MRLVESGVAGINIEDGPDAPELLTAKIEALRNAISKAGTDLFINVRSDVFLAGLVEKPGQVEESIRRGRIYTSAGADGLFLPGIVASGDIEAVVREVSVPLNVMAWPGLAAAGELGMLGVRRLSAGSGIAQMLWGAAQRLAEHFLRTGCSTGMMEGTMSYSQLQGLFVGRPG
jgi:2-methylisocitrate lyase-like PEP mutase family enzyme